MPPGHKLHEQSQQGVERLIAQLGQAKDSKRSYQAFLKLLKDKPKKALPLLAKAIPGFSVYARSLAFSLISSYPRELSEKTFRKLLECADPSIELRAALALYRFGNRKAISKINNLLNKASPGRKRAELLRQLGSLSDPGLQGTVRSLLGPGADFMELDAALDYLSLSKDPKGPKAAKRLLDSPDLPSSSRSLIQAFLLSRNQVSETNNLAKELASTRDFYRLQKFLMRADTLPKPILGALVQYLQHHKNSYQSRYAIDLLTKHHYREALPLIRKLVNSKQAMVSQAAFSALQKLGGFSDRSSLYLLLKSKDLSLVLKAAKTLRRLDDFSGLPRVLEIIRSQAPQAVSIRYQAIQALGNFRSPRAVPLLLQTLLDPKPLNRSQASYALGMTLRCLLPYKRIDLSSAGYKPSAPASTREKAVARLQAWWKRISRRK